MRFTKEDLEDYVLTAADEKRNNVETFLHGIPCAVDEIRCRVGTQFGNASDFLFVSTTSSGLAGSTSDIDVIVIVDKEHVPTSRMNTTMFVEGRRLGIKAFSKEEIAEAITRLRDMCCEPPATIAASKKRLENDLNISWTDLERCINGYSYNSGTPFLSGVPYMAQAWFGLAFEQFRQGVILTMLAHAAGEMRGERGYALVAVRSLMDAVMASAGRIHANPKWTLERWFRFARQRPADEHVGMLIAEITHIWNRTLDAVTAGPPESLASDLQKLYKSVREFYDVDLVEDRSTFRLHPKFALSPFIEGIHLATGIPNKFVIVEKITKDKLQEYAWETNMEDRLGARSLLALLRAGYLHMPIDQTRLTPLVRGVE